MSNYLQSKSKLIWLMAGIALLSGYALAANPYSEKYHQEAAPTTVQQPTGLTEHYLSAVQNQMGKLFNGNTKTATRNNPFPHSEQSIAGLQNTLNKQIQSFIYNPDHPTPFLEQLIAGMTFVTNMQKQLIGCGEKIADSSNKTVLQIKENYAGNLKYLEALKHQKIKLEQIKNNQ